MLESALMGLARVPSDVGPGGRGVLDLGIRPHAISPTIYLHHPSQGLNIPITP